MPNLRQLLIKRECRGGRPDTEVYLDSENRPTVGIGHLVVAQDKLKVGDTVQSGQIQAFYRRDTALAVSAAKKQAAQAGIKDAQFLVHLASVNYQLGPRWTKILKKVWANLRDGNYEQAADEAKRSKWNADSPVRVKDFQRALLALPPKEPD